MQLREMNNDAQLKVYRWLCGVLILFVIAEFLMLAMRLTGPGDVPLFDSSLELVHIICLSLAVSVIYLHKKNLGRLARREELEQQQVNAMLSMFSTVRHDLNNDMQVIVGNAELAQAQISSGGNLRKPVDNIAEASRFAVERIEQLSVFTHSGRSARKAIDLNATLRESMAKVTNELPAIVVLRLELEYLPIRVVADRYLLGLSLSHLIRQTARTMQHGGEIEIRTTDLGQAQGSSDNAIVNLEVFIVRALASATDPARYREDAVYHDTRLSEHFDTTKALVERSGAIMVGHSVSAGGSLINMRFVSDEARIQAVPSQLAIGRQSFVKA